MRSRVQDSRVSRGFVEDFAQCDFNFKFSLYLVAPESSHLHYRVDSAEMALPILP